MTPASTRLSGVTSAPSSKRSRSRMLTGTVVVRCGPIGIASFEYGPRCLPRPRARSVPRLRSVWPIWLRTWVMRSFLFAIVRLLRRRDRSDGLLGRRLLLRGLRLLLGERQDVGDRLPARLRHLLRAAEALESLDGVDELRGDAAVRAEHDEARPLGRPEDALAHPLVAARAALSHRELGHARFPTFLR